VITQRRAHAHRATHVNAADMHAPTNRYIN
jgi:hypothetical protein